MLLSDFMFAVLFVSVAVLACVPAGFLIERMIRALYNRVPAVRNYFDSISFDEEDSE